MRAPDTLYPKVWRARSAANAGLTGARLHWSFHSERYHIKLLLVANVVLFFGLLQIAREQISGWVWLGFFVWILFFAVIVGVALYVDDKTWKGRTIKVGSLPPIPWRPNLNLYVKARGKVETLEPLPDGRTPDPMHPLDTQEYGIAFVNEVEQWVEGVKPFDPIVVAPVLELAHAVVEEGEGPKAKRVAAEARSKGIGWWSGMEYRVPGTPHIYFLGHDGLTEHIRDQKVKQLLVGLDRELRTRIHSLTEELSMSKSKWYRPVIYIEELPSQDEVRKAKPQTSPLDMKLVLENMDLRAQLDEAMTHAEKIMDAYTQSINRLRGT